jgi:hypothetical protein
MKTPEQFLANVSYVTYHSANAATHEAWLAYPVFNGEQWLVRSTGKTEADALVKAKEIMTKEAHKQAGLIASVKPDVVDASFKFPSKPDASPSAGGGRGKVFIGKTWMVLRDKKGVVVERARVADDQLTEYETKGWTRGGPRTK